MSDAMMKFEDAVKEMRKGHAVKLVDQSDQCLTIHHRAMYKCRMQSLKVATKCLLSSDEIMGDQVVCTEEYMNKIEETHTPEHKLHSDEVCRTDIDQEDKESILSKAVFKMEEIFADYRDAFVPNFHIVR